MCSAGNEFFISCALPKARRIATTARSYYLANFVVVGWELAVDRDIRLCHGRLVDDYWDWKLIEPPNGPSSRFNYETQLTISTDYFLRWLFHHGRVYAEKTWRTAQFSIFPRRCLVQDFTDRGENSGFGHPRWYAFARYRVFYCRETWFLIAVSL